MQSSRMKIFSYLLCAAATIWLIAEGYVQHLPYLILPSVLLTQTTAAQLNSHYITTSTKFDPSSLVSPTTLKQSAFPFTTSESIHDDLRARLGVRRRKTEQKIAIFAAFSNNKNDAEKSYKAALATLRCYTRYHNYHMEILYGEDLPRFAKICNQSEFFFKRHCLARQILINYDWMLAIDGDVGITNPYYLLEDHIDEGVSVMLYDRYYNSEVAATNYFVRNDSVGYQFLEGYANYQFKLPNSFHGTDNGALHHHLLTMIYPHSSLLPICTAIWNSSRGFGELFQFESCVRLAFGTIRRFLGQILLARKGEAWVRDAWITNSNFSHRDFLLHSWRERFVNTDGARSRWRYPYDPLPNPEKCEPDENLANIWHFVPQLYRPQNEVSATLNALKKEADDAFWKHMLEIRKKYELSVF